GDLDTDRTRADAFYVRFAPEFNGQWCPSATFKEDMEKVNIKFHDNYTVTYQHKKILQFVPELSVDKNLRITTPNIPLLTISTQSKYLSFFVAKTISVILTATKYKPFISLTADELVFGYDDTLVSLAHRFYPRNRRPMEKMGLLNGVDLSAIAHHHSVQA
uniref:Uncharacterized protein n=1 Tax=Anopheles maculatus TaxID=74869 RepID=A0A182T635_9DIPT